MFELFLPYVLPFVMIILIVAYIVLRIFSSGGPTFLFICFFLISFGPSLLYALIMDDSNTTVFMISVLAGLVVTGALALLLYRKR